MKPLAIRTIEELERAQEKHPAMVEKLFSRVTILPDLEDYLKHLHDNSIDIKFKVHLRRQKERPLGIHPSSACKKGVCPLKLYWECTGEVPPKRGYDKRMQEIWDTGTMLHDRAQYLLEGTYGEQFEKEVGLSIPKLLVIGHTDGIFVFEIDGVRIVLEIKSIKEGGSYGWEKVQLKPMEDNVRQAHFYMKAENIPFGIVFYVAKNTGEFKEHPIMFNQDTWDDLEKTIKPVVAAVKDGGKIVKAAPSWHCKWCDFQYACTPGRRNSHGKKAFKRKMKTGTRLTSSPPCRHGGICRRTFSRNP
jgi:CRISPR/Cas system-associated exonuclease Cas4 (RecB family)